MCCMVLEYIKCTVTVMQLWWSCDEYVLQYLCSKSAKNGNENIKIYSKVKCGGGGLVMTKNV